MYRELPAIEDSRDEEVASVIGRWDFCAHDFSEDELIHAGSLMLEHALKMPELDKWRISFGKSPTNVSLGYLTNNQLGR
jgi:hypothetical protein